MFVVSLLAVPASADSPSQHFQSYNIKPPLELASVSPEQLGQLDSDSIAIYGLALGISESEVRRVVATHHLHAIKLGPQSIGLFEVNGGDSTGIDIFLERGKVAQIVLDLRTRFYDKAMPQSKYLDRMSPALRMLFEDDPNRLMSILGTSKGKRTFDNGYHRKYVYEYPARGLQLVIFSFLDRKQNVWIDQLSSVHFFPGTRRPNRPAE